MEKSVEEADRWEEIDGSELVFNDGTCRGLAVFGRATEPLGGDDAVDLGARGLEIFPLPPLVSILIVEKFLPAFVEGGATVLHPVDVAGTVGPDPDELFPFVIFPPGTVPILSMVHWLVPGLFKSLEVGSDLSVGDWASKEEEENR